MTRAYGAGLPWRERLRRRWGGGMAEALAGRHARIVCVSDSTAEEIGRHYRLRPDAIVPNGIDLECLLPALAHRRALSLGSQPTSALRCSLDGSNFGKGAGIMERACSRAGYRLVVAGPTGAPGALNLGAVAPERLALAYSAVDCVLLPSLYEACSYVALEALACGVPLLTTRVGSSPRCCAASPSMTSCASGPTSST